MKQFTILLGSLISVLVFLAFFQNWSDARVKANKDFVPAPVYDATGAMLDAIDPKEAESRIAPVYDATGAMLDAIDPSPKVTIHPVYDATGAMLEAINP
jgi:hypothetical protein